MSGGSWFAKKDRTHMQQVGPFWYPTNFYPAADDHVMGPILREFCYSSLNHDNYEYLLLIRGAKLSDAFGIMRDFLNADGAMALNLDATERRRAIDAVNDLFAPPDQKSRAAERREIARSAEKTNRTPGRVKTKPIVPPVYDGIRPGLRTSLEKALETVTGSVHRMMNNNVLNDAIWNSPIFLNVHDARVNRFARRFRWKSSFDADGLAREEGADQRIEEAGRDFLLEDDYYQRKYGAGTEDDET
jgi:hypothetical protein